MNLVQSFDFMTDNQVVHTNEIISMSLESITATIQRDYLQLPDKFDWSTVHNISRMKIVITLMLWSSGKVCKSHFCFSRHLYHYLFVHFGNSFIYLYLRNSLHVVFHVDIYIYSTLREQDKNLWKIICVSATNDFLFHDIMWDISAHEGSSVN